MMSETLLFNGSDAAAGGFAPTMAGPALPPSVTESQPAEEQNSKPAPVPGNRKELKPFPFYYYKDFSNEVDPDPFVPLTTAGRVPNFPAKMHAILSREDLSDIVAWLPHGRSWRVLKPREFEIKVVPIYFEHAKFSSFIRQANGWGFRRITQGPDRNSYYHEKFLRGMPFLCKSMKRPGISEKKSTDPDHEPDFYKISEIHPVPEKTDDDSILLHCTVAGGPKARMPIYTGLAMPKALEAPKKQEALVAPADEQKLKMVVSSEKQVCNTTNVAPVQAPPSPVPVPVQQQQMQMQAPPSMMAPTAPHSINMMAPGGNNLDALATASTLAFQHAAAAPGMAFNPQAAAQFAAGFAMATAFSQQHFSSLFGNLNKSN